MANLNQLVPFGASLAVTGLTWGPQRLRRFQPPQIQWSSVALPLQRFCNKQRCGLDDSIRGGYGAQHGMTPVAFTSREIQPWTNDLQVAPMYLEVGSCWDGQRQWCNFTASNPWWQCRICKKLLNLLFPTWLINVIKQQEPWLQAFLVFRACWLCWRYVAISAISQSLK